MSRKGFKIKLEISCKWSLPSFSPLLFAFPVFIRRKYLYRPEIISTSNCIHEKYIISDLSLLFFVFFSLF